MGFLYSWSNIKRVLAKLLACIYTYIHIQQSQLQSLFWVVSWLLCISETLLNAAVVLFHTTQYIPVFAWDFYSATRNPDTFRSRSWNTINSSTHVLSHHYPAWEPKYTQAGLEYSRQCCHRFASVVIVASYPGRSLILKKTTWQLIQVQTVNFCCPGVGSTNQISEHLW